MEKENSSLFGMISQNLLALATGGNAGRDITMTIKNIRPLDTLASSTMLAGAAKIDITPAPGMPMGGYSLMGKRGIGVRTKLYARAIYIKPKIGRPVALVQCDLLSGSQILHHKVTELIAKNTDIEAQGLFIAGTHTHSAPANFFESIFYNNFASGNKGFEQSFFDFLSKRVAMAIEQAYKNKRPAKIATGTAKIHGATRNRSLPAYHRNKNLKEKPDALKAINPLMHMIRVDCQTKDGSWRPAGAFSNFSIHPTAIGTKNRLYNADVFAYIERQVEWGIARKYKTPFTPVHAAANFTHGDNTPDIPIEIDEGFIEAKRIGKIIGNAAFDLFQSLDKKLSDDVPVRYLAKEIDVLAEPVAESACLCKGAAVGNALTAGATTRYTPVLRRMPFFAPGWPRWVFTNSRQGHKRVIGGVFQPLVLPKHEFPHNLFLQIIQVADKWLMPVPFEVCYEAGARIMARAQQKGEQAGLSDISQYVIMGCSNGYWGYVTTPEEYSFQFYEGGHTLYGPETGAFLASHLGCMVQDMAQNRPGDLLPDKWVFKLRAKDYLPENIKPNGKRIAGSRPKFYPSKENLEAYWAFDWHDVCPNLINFHEPLVDIQVSSDNKIWEPLVSDGQPINDSGYDISIALKGVSSKTSMGHYEAKWHDPEKVAGKSYRFLIRERQGMGVLYSEVFY